MKIEKRGRNKIWRKWDDIKLITEGTVCIVCPGIFPRRVLDGFVPDI